MLQPDFQEFSRLSRGATLVPVVKSVSADLLTPVSAFLAVAEEENMGGKDRPGLREVKLALLELEKGA